MNLCQLIPTHYHRSVNILPELVISIIYEISCNVEPCMRDPNERALTATDVSGWFKSYSSIFAYKHDSVTRI